MRQTGRGSSAPSSSSASSGVTRGVGTLHGTSNADSNGFQGFQGFGGQQQPGQGVDGVFTPLSTALGIQGRRLTTPSLFGVPAMEFPLIVLVLAAAIGALAGIRFGAAFFIIYMLYRQQQQQQQGQPSPTPQNNN